MTLDDRTVPLRALRLLAVDFGHLPAPDVDVSRVFPKWLRLSFHGTSGESLAAFEQWRTALGIAPDAVGYGTQSDGRTRVLKAEGDFAGAVIMLTAFADVPVSNPAPAGQAGGVR
ncbi:hypothetical protein ABZ371_01460 [Streptomyces sp. NPDC005899]|uniref:hypothetical protein n=1 Tax=Streptomyces sp. NPDC005899 TaxID=3155716 RepID=UPI0033EBC2C1